MRSILELKKRKGIAGLDILLSVVVMLFVIGLLIMIFALMGAEIQQAVDEDITNNETAVNLINDTYTQIAGVTDWYGILITITIMVVLILLTVLIISAIRGTGFLGAGSA